MTNGNSQSLSSVLILLLALAANSQLRAGADSENGAALPEAKEIDTAQFETLFASIKPSATELRWMEIPWLGSVGEGLATAEAAKKPLFLWAMNGHPLGTC
jgi:hypothetical protein